MLSMVFMHGISQSVIKKDTRFLRDKMNKLVLITQIPDDSLREAVAGSIIQAFQKKHIGIMNADAFMRLDTGYAYSRMEREFTDNGIDGILIVKLIDVTLSDMYIFPGDVLPPDAYNYYEFYSVYFYYDLPDIGAPDYLRRGDRRFRIDFNLYSNKGDMIILAAQTKELVPIACEKEVGALGKKLAGILLSNRLVEKQ